MKMFRNLVIVIGIALALTASSSADTKNYPKLIVGKWKVMKADEGTVPEGAVFEFAADGKLKFHYSADGQNLAFDGTYKLDGSKFTITVQFSKDEGRSQQVEIKSLDQTTLTLIDAEKKIVQLKRS
jgi:uncharacterized protein (TIGR03066 family)